MPRFSAHLEDLPSVRAQTDRVMRAVLQRHNVAVLLQRSMSTDAFSDALRNALYSRVMVSDIGDGSLNLKAVLGRAFSQGLGNAPASDDLARILEAARDLVVVIRIGSADSAGTEPAMVLNEWARLQRVDPGLPVFCVLAEGAAGLANLPREDVHVRFVHTSTGPSMLEMRQVCRAESADGGATLQAVWREHLGPALAGNDVRLLETVWDHLEAPFAQVKAVLIGYAHQRGWSPAHIQQLRRNLPPRSVCRVGLLSGDVPQSLRPAWADGLLQWAPETGLELHSAALAVSGGLEQVRHRAWRAQAGLVLPLIDHIRVSICRYMLDTRGADWAVADPPEDPAEAERLRCNSMTCQLGHLTNVLDRERATRDVCAVARRMRNMRNDLAHYRLISFDDLEDLDRHVSRTMRDWQDTIWA